MNLKRKILRMVDLRVHHHSLVERSGIPVRHASAHSATTLTPDSPEFKSFSRADKMTEAVV